MATIETRISSNQLTTFRAKIRLKGFPTQTASFARKTDAKRWVQATEAAIREGRYFNTSEAKRHTLADLVDRYIKEVLPTKSKNASNTKRHLLWWKKHIGNYSLADVTPSIIAEKRNELLSSITIRKKLISPSTVVRYMASLSVALTIAVKEFGWLDDSPIRKVTKPTQPQGRVRYLSDSERANLLNACSQSNSKFIYTVVVIALSTGMRQGEIMNLRWNQVDLSVGQITLNQTKNGDSRAVPLTGFALDLLSHLAKIRHINNDYLFPGLNTKKPIDLRKAWRTVSKQAELEDFRFHDLRHSAASYLAMNGASLIEIAAVLGHRTLQMVKRYSHISKSHTHSVVSSMNDKIFAGVKA